MTHIIFYTKGKREIAKKFAYEKAGLPFTDFLRCSFFSL